MEPGTLAALGRTAVGVLGTQRTRPRVSLLQTGWCSLDPGSAPSNPSTPLWGRRPRYRTWREQFISRDSRISSVSTDWQMGQPSPCRATLFNSRKLETAKKTEEFSFTSGFGFCVIGLNRWK